MNKTDHTRQTACLKTIFCFCICLFIFANTKAQFINYGADPFKLKWNIVDLKHYKLVYPVGNDSMAYQYALYLENAYRHIEKTMNPPRKYTFPVILHPDNMLSNGMVAWAPRRMELITTPSSDLYAQRWDRQLVLHESRHVMQTSIVMQGIFLPLYYLLGEQAAGVGAFFLPKWFLEGDAVVAETALSSSGRGRLPEFNMTYRAQLMTGESYSFDKWFLGSYKNYTGNYYALGYDITAYARYRYGGEVWNNAVNRYVSRILSIPPFSNAVKHYTGLTNKKLFEETFSFLKGEWNIQDSLFRATNPPEPDILSPRQKRYTAYNDPQALSDSSALAVKSNLTDLRSLTQIENGREKRLSYLGNINSRILLNNNRVYWTEYVPGLRWTHKNYSVVKYYDLTTKRTVTLTPRQRYLAPAVDADGKRIAVSRFSPDGKNQVLLIDPDNGKETARFDVPDNAFVKDLTFGPDGTLIAVGVNNKGITIIRLDPDNDRWDELLPPTTANITSPTWQDGKLLFESGLNGTNHLYYLDPADRKTYRLAGARFGAFSPTLSPGGKRLFFSDYQADGYRIASLLADSLKPEAADFDRPYRHTLAEAISQQEQFNLDTARLEPVPFEPRRYRRVPHLLRIHSWAPFYYDVNDILNLDSEDLKAAVKPGITALSQNTLNTTIAQAGWYYWKGYHHGKLSFTYMGWYPVLNVNIDYGGRTFDIGWDKNEAGQPVAHGRHTDRTLVEADARIYIPFNLTRGYYVSGFQPTLTYKYTNNNYRQLSNGKQKNYQYLLPEVRYYYYRKLALRDILPKWGYQIRLQYLKSPFDNENFGSLYAARLTAYVPGLRQNDGLMLRLGYQYQELKNKTFYIPTQLIDAPRGYGYNYATRQQIAFKADYSFNICYPDLSLGALVYIKRVRGNLFYDLSRNQAKKSIEWTNQSSFGGDLIFDWNVLQAEFPLSLGIRVTKPIDYGRVELGALFSVSF